MTLKAGTHDTPRNSKCSSENIATAVMHGLSSYQLPKGQLGERHLSKHHLITGRGITKLVATILLWLSGSVELDHMILSTKMGITNETLLLQSGAI